MQLCHRPEAERNFPIRNEPLDMFEKIAPPLLGHPLMWEALVDISDISPLGMGPLGERRIVPILGGSFRGGPTTQTFTVISLLAEPTAS